jgi:putative Mn2+ efflux pump MntP
LFSVWEGIMLALACSADAFALGFAYGGKRIRIPPVSGLSAALLCTVFLGGALIFGGLVRPYLPGWLAETVAAGVLFGIGLVKLFEKSEPKDGDRNKDYVISPGEAVLLSAALSLDGLAVGFGAGLGSANILAAIIASAVIGIAAILGGCKLGNRFSRSLPVNPAKIGGLILICLAVLEVVL